MRSSGRVLVGSWPSPIGGVRRQSGPGRVRPAPRPSGIRIRARRPAPAGSPWRLRPHSLRAVAIAPIGPASQPIPSCRVRSSGFEALGRELARTRRIRRVRRRLGRASGGPRRRTRDRSIRASRAASAGSPRARVRNLPARGTRRPKRRAPGSAEVIVQLPPDFDLVPKIVEGQVETSERRLRFGEVVQRERGFPALAQ